MEIKNKLITIMTLLLMSSSSYSVDVNLSTTPLFLGGQAAPLVMLVMGRDHTLYYEAYNDATDLNGNGAIDEYELRYAPKTDSAYYGIFDSSFCYDYDSTNQYFYPSAKANLNKSCGNSKWSGDFLNYVTTSRIDAIRKVLYGGQRTGVYDNAGTAVVTRTVLPHDAHSWGKVYRSEMASDDHEYKFTLSDYAGCADCSSVDGTNQVFFANTSLNSTTPILRVIKVNRVVDSKNVNIWGWVSKENPVADSTITTYDNNYTTGEITVSPTDYVVRVLACKPLADGTVSVGCQKYNSIYQPTGLLQKYADNMKFGLITGSYTHNLSGGLLRQVIHFIGDEITTADGKFKGSGVIGNLEKLKVTGFNYSNRTYDSNCGWITGSVLSDGQCKDWGNPLAEILYESIRYFAGKNSASYNTAADILDQTAWSDPFNSSNTPGVSTCSKPINLVINSLTPTFDSDELPDSSFQAASYSDNGSINGNTFSATTSTNTISTQEGVNNKTYFIGDNGSNTNKNAPTAKTVSSLSSIRGLSPENPSLQGSFYSAGVSYFAHVNDLTSTQSGDQKLMTHVVALSSPLPQIKIAVGANTVTLVPTAKTVTSSADYYPTDQIVDYYVESLTQTSGSFIINFEDVEQGADHDMDMIARYSYQVTGSSVAITVTTLYAKGGLNQHAGYVITGTSADGLYYDVRDILDNNETYYQYALDTPNNDATHNYANRNSKLPLTKTRTFTASGSGAQFLPSPLWYAAKWGGFTDKNGNNLPDTGEWDTITTGQPDNYYPVTNMSNLPTLLGQAFANIAAGSKTTTALAYSSPIITTASTSYAYKTSFNSDNWTGDLKAFQIDSNGALAANATWSASTQLDAITVANRKIFTYTNGSKVSLTATSTLSAAQITTLLTDAGLTSSDTNIQNLVNYLRGDKTNEGTTSGKFRVRNHRLGDIVDSTPVSGTSITDSRKFVIVGANDGMVHIFDATSGEEIFAYMPRIPTAVNSYHPSVAALAKQNYSHQFYVNGGISLAKVTSGGTTKLIAIGTLGQGGQTVYALDLTDLRSPTATTNLLWEFTDPELGYTGGTPAIVTLKDETRAVVFGNGYNNTQADGSVSATGNASIFVVNALTGVLISRLDTKVGASADPLAKSRANAMAQPVVLADNVYSSSGVRKAKAIYAGDLFGNLWKWNIDFTDKNNWVPGNGTAAAPSPIFVAKDPSNNRQPITTRPSLAMHSSGDGVMVLFGTGKYVESTDNTYDLPISGTPTTFGIQSFYGIRDYKGGANIGSVARSDLQQRVITEEIKIGDNYKRLIDTSSDMDTLPAAIDWDTKKGWYMDLSNGDATISGTGAAAASVNGERTVTNSSVSLQKLAFTTLIPGTDVCSGTNSGWSMELNASEGTLYVPLNNDVNLQDESTISYLTSQKSTSGILSSPSKIYSNDGSSVHSLNQIVSSNGNVGTTTGDTITSKQESWKQAY
jgi:type IV pilus assembly protein PilY1